MTATLTGTAALVTGASSGIGAATARALAAHGAAVAVVARRADRLDELKADIESTGGTALAVPADVTDAEQVAAAVSRAIGELGRLDTVVNNAGLMRMGPAAEAPLQDWDDLVRVNVQGVLYVTRAALPHLVDAAADSPRGVADIVTISSTAGWVARPGTAVYSLTKFGVNAFSAKAFARSSWARGFGSAWWGRARSTPKSVATWPPSRAKHSIAGPRAWSSCNPRTSPTPCCTWSPATAG
jgi:NADP-dependent 3-hydroxy acid dehydrogenase YdfG